MTTLYLSANRMQMQIIFITGYTQRQFVHVLEVVLMGEEGCADRGGLVAVAAAGVGFISVLLGVCGVGEEGRVAVLLATESLAFFAVFEEL
jgi:hypothetical protein